MTWDKARDPDRIPEVLAALETKWQEVPDQRLGQMLINLVRRELAPEPENEGRALFAVEDDTWLRWFADATEDTSV